MRAGRPFYAHVWAASSMRAMPEYEIPPAMPVDHYSLRGLDFVGHNPMLVITADNDLFGKPEFM